MAKVKAKVSTVVGKQLPEFVREDHPYFINFLEAYYEWLEVNYKPRDLENVIDIDSTVDEYVEHFANQFASLMPKTMIGDRRLVMKHAKEIYLAKGTPKSYDLLFRLMFNESPQEIYYPKKDMLRASDGKWQQQNIMRGYDLIGDSFNLIGQVVYQDPISFGDQGAQARVESIVKYNVGVELITEINLSDSNRLGTFQPNQDIYGLSTIDGSRIYVRLIPMITSLEITTGGKYYLGGDKIIVDESTGIPATATAILDTANGTVSEIKVTNGGLGYIEQPVVTIQGNGINATARAVISFGRITAINVTNPGTGYTDTPIVIISNSTAGGTDFNGEISTVKTGSLTGIHIANGGAGHYYKQPILFDNSDAGFGNSSAVTTAVAEVSEVDYGMLLLETAHRWVANESVVGSIGLRYIHERNEYEVIGEGVFGIIPPTHTYGTTTNGTASLKYVGRSSGNLLLEGDAGRSMMEQNRIYSYNVNGELTAPMIHNTDSVYYTMNYNGTAKTPVGDYVDSTVTNPLYGSIKSVKLINGGAHYNKLPIPYVMTDFILAMTTEIDTNIVTCRTEFSHELIEGQNIIITGSLNNIVDGSFSVANIIDSYTFTFKASGTTIFSFSGSIAAPYRKQSLWADKTINPSAQRKNSSAKLLALSDQVGAVTKGIISNFGYYYDTAKVSTPAVLVVDNINGSFSAGETISLLPQLLARENAIEDGFLLESGLGKIKSESQSTASGTFDEYVSSNGTLRLSPASSRQGILLEDGSSILTEEYISFTSGTPWIQDTGVALNQYLNHNSKIYRVTIPGTTAKTFTRVGISGNTDALSIVVASGLEPFRLGMLVSGTGVATGATISAISNNSLTLSLPNVSPVVGNTITFSNPPVHTAGKVINGTATLLAVDGYITADRNKLVGEKSGIFSKHNTLRGESSGSTAVIVDGEIAQIKSVIGAYGETTGSFLDSDGKLSDGSKKLQDSFYYQDYSYVIRIGQSVSKYRDAVKKLLHPTGLALFGEVSLINKVGALMRIMNNEKAILTNIVNLNLRVSALAFGNWQEPTNRLLVENSDTYSHIFMEGGIREAVRLEDSLDGNEQYLLSEQGNIFVSERSGEDGRNVLLETGYKILSEEQQSIFFPEHVLQEQYNFFRLEKDNTHAKARNPDIRKEQWIIAIEDFVPSFADDDVLKLESALEDGNGVIIGEDNDLLLEDGGRFLKQQQYSRPAPSMRILQSEMLPPLIIPELPLNTIHLLEMTPSTFKEIVFGITSKVDFNYLDEGLLLEDGGKLLNEDGSWIADRASYPNIPNDKSVTDIFVESVPTNVELDNLLLETGSFMLSEDVYPAGYHFTSTINAALAGSRIITGNATKSQFSSQLVQGMRIKEGLQFSISQYYGFGEGTVTQVNFEADPVTFTIELDNALATTHSETPLVSIAFTPEHYKLRCDHQSQFIFNSNFNSRVSPVKSVDPITGVITYDNMSVKVQARPAFRQSGGSLSFLEQRKFGFAPYVYGSKGSLQVVPGTTYIGVSWVADTPLLTKQVVNNANKAYEVVTAGTTGSTAPTHTTGIVTNGTAELQYIGPVKLNIEYSMPPGYTGGWYDQYPSPNRDYWNNETLLLESGDTLLNETNNSHLLEFMESSGDTQIKHFANVTIYDIINRKNKRSKYAVGSHIEIYKTAA
jgi:hypothetical protein